MAAEGLMEAPPSAVHLTAPDLRDPLGSLQFVKGDEYMTALSKLGYNVENMTSPIPLMTKIAEAGSNLLDMGMQRRLENQKAQADLAYKTAQARYTDSEAANNETLLGSRLKLLQNQADQAATNAKIASSTADDQIAISGLNRQAKELEVQQAKDGIAKANAIQAKWEAEYKNFPSGLNNPDYPTQRDQWYEKNGDLVFNPATRDQVAKWRAQQDEIYGRQADAQVRGALLAEVTKSQADGDIPLHLPVSPNQMSSDQLHDLIIKKNLKSTLAQMRSALSTLPEVPQQLGEEDQANPEQRAIRARLLNFSNQLEAYLGSDDSLKLIRGGQMPNINANGQGTDDYARVLSDYQAYTTRAAAAQAVTNPPVKIRTAPAKGKEGAEIEFTMPFDEARRRGLIDEQGNQIRTPAAQPMNEEEKAFRQKQANDAIRAEPGNEGVRKVAEAYVKGQISTDQFAQQLRVFKRARSPATAAPTPEYVGIGGGQFGGFVTAGGINGPQTGLGRARGGLIPPAAVAGYGQGYEEGGKVRGYQEGGPSLTLGSTDTVPAMLSPGEFVLNAGAVKDIGLPMLEALNESPSSQEAQSDVTNVATPLLLGETGQPPPQMSAPAPIALPPVAQPGTGEWPHVAPISPPRQPLAPRAELAAPAAPTQTPAVTTGPATLDINKPLAATGIGQPIGGEMTGLATNFGHDVNGRPDTYMLSQLGPGSRIGAFGTDVVNPTTVGASLPSATIRANIGDPTNPAVRRAIQSGRYQVRVQAPNGRSGQFRIVDIGPGPNEPGKIDLTGSAMRQLGVTDSFNARFQIVDTGAQTYQAGGFVAPGAPIVEANAPAGVPVSMASRSANQPVSTQGFWQDVLTRGGLMRPTTPIPSSLPFDEPDPSSVNIKGSWPYGEIPPQSQMAVPEEKMPPANLFKMPIHDPSQEDRQEMLDRIRGYHGLNIYEASARAREPLPYSDRRTAVQSLM